LDGWRRLFSLGSLLRCVKDLAFGVALQLHCLGKFGWGGSSAGGNVDFKRFALCLHDAHRLLVLVSLLKALSLLLLLMHGVGVGERVFARRRGDAEARAVLGIHE